MEKLSVLLAQLGGKKIQRDSAASSPNDGASKWRSPSLK